MHNRLLKEYLAEKNTFLEKEAFAPLTLPLTALFSALAAYGVGSSAYHGLKYLGQGDLPNAGKEALWTGLHAASAFPLMGMTAQSAARAARGLEAASVAARAKQGLSNKALLDAMYKGEKRWLPNWMHGLNIWPARAGRYLQDPKSLDTLKNIYTSLESPTSTLGKAVKESNTLKWWLPMGVEMGLPLAGINEPYVDDMFKQAPLQQYLENNRL